MEFNKTQAMFILVMSDMMYGFVGLFSRYLDKIGFSSIDITFTRLGITFITIFIIVLIFKRQLLKVDLRAILFFLSFGVFKLMADIAFFYAIDNLPMALASILQMMFPFYIIVISLLIFKEKVDRRKIIAMLVAFAGCTMITGGMFGTGDITSMGIVSALISGLFVAIYIIGGTFSYQRGYDPLAYVMFCSLIADLIALPFINHEVIFNAFTDFDVVPYLFGLGIIASLIPMFLDAWSAKYLPPTVISIIALFEVVSSAVIGALVFDETLDLLDFIGIAFVMLSIVVINIKIDKNARRYLKEHPEKLEELKEKFRFKKESP